MKRFVLILFIILLFIIINLNKTESFSPNLDYENIKNEFISKLNLIEVPTRINYLIPKIVNKIYIDKTMELDNIEPEINTLIKNFSESNPGYSVKIWSGNECRKYLIKNFDKKFIDCFDSIKPYALKADFFRYCIIWNEGGWYSDLKQDILIQLKDFDGYSFVGMVDLGNKYCLKNFCIQNCFFGSIKGHPVLEECINMCLYNVKNKYYGKSNLEPTGPRLFGKAFQNMREIPDKIIFGYFVHDIPGSSCHLNGKRIIIHKCNSCKKGNDWNFGNNYQAMWEQKNIYN